MKSFLSFCFIVVLSVTGFAGEHSIKLSEISFLEDPDSRMTAQEAINSPGFQKARKTIVSSKGMIWVKANLNVPVSNPKEGLVLFSGSTEMVRSMEAFYVDGEEVTPLGKCHYNLLDPSCQNPNLQYAFSIPYRELRKNPMVYLRIDHDRTPIPLNFYLMTRPYYNITNTSLSYMIGLTTGIALLLSFASLLFYFANPKAVILIFGAFAFARFLVTVQFRGIWDAFIPAQFPAATELWPFVSSMSFLLELVFLQYTFRLKKVNKKINTFVNLLNSTILTIGLFSFTEAGRTFFWSNLYSIITIIQITTLAVLASLIYKKQKYALLLTIAWLPGIVGCLLWALSQSNFILVDHWAISYTPVHMRPFQLFMLCFVMFAKVQDMNKELSIAREREQQSNVVKTLLRTLSHDLSNTASVILLHSEIGLNSASKEFKNIFKIIHEAILTQNRILNHAKKTYLNREGQLLRLYPVSVKSCMEEALDILSSKSKSKGLTVKTQYLGKDFEILSEAVCLTHQIFVNLLDNAIKFTPSGKNIFVEVDASDTNLLKVKIKDEGIGMPDDLRSRIFEEAAQIQRAGTKEEPGTGLGLLVVRDFVAFFGGKIDVLSEEAKGTIFTLTFLKNAPSTATNIG